MPLRIIFLLFFLSACAPPVYESQQDFVPVRELSAVQFAEEGLQYMSRGRYNEATTLFYRASELYPEVLPIKLNLAISLAELGAYEESQGILDDLIYQGGYTAPARKALAAVFFAQGDERSGNSEFEMAFEQEVKRKQYGKAYTIAMRAARLNDEVGRMEDALCFAFKALGVSGAIEARVFIARLYLDDGAFENAFRFAELKEGGQKKQQVELKLIRAISQIGEEKGNETALKVLGRLELAVRQRPELLPEIQALRSAVTILTLEGSEEEKLASLEEEQREEFNSAYGGAANQSAQARFWPLAVRRVFELQIPPEGGTG